MHVTLDAETVVLLDEHCERWGVTRIEALQRCIAEAVAREQALAEAAGGLPHSSGASVSTDSPLVPVSVG